MWGCYLTCQNQTQAVPDQASRCDELGVRICCIREPLKCVLMEVFPTHLIGSQGVNMCPLQLKSVYMGERCLNLPRGPDISMTTFGLENKSFSNAAKEDLHYRVQSPCLLLCAVNRGIHSSNGFWGTPGKISQHQLLPSGPHISVKI